ncbi:MAG: thioesterase family protein [Rhodospirillales bacterium]|nr:MAG: thioesterase family protein [Rhodospirillales bacterium]
MTIDAPLCLYRATVKSEWLDYNGHMNEAYYVRLFSQATDAFMDYSGQDAAYRARTNSSIYTLETHVMYLREVSEGEPVRIETRLLGRDEKRYRLFHAMYHGDSGDLLATGEHMLLHVDMSGPRSAPFPPEIADRLMAIEAAHAHLPAPEQAGRRIAFPRARR